MSSRLVTEDDRAAIDAWIQAEPEHSHNPDFYIAPPNGISSVMYCDDRGPVFVARFEPCLRLHTDFNKDAGSERIQSLLKSSFAEVESAARNQGFRQLIFESVARPLIAFCRRRLGCKQSPNEITKQL